LIFKNIGKIIYLKNNINQTIEYHVDVVLLIFIHSCDHFRPTWGGGGGGGGRGVGVLADIETKVGLLELRSCLECGLLLRLYFLNSLNFLIKI